MRNESVKSNDTMKYFLFFIVVCIIGLFIYKLSIGNLTQQVKRGEVRATMAEGRTDTIREKSKRRLGRKLTPVEVDSTGITSYYDTIKIDESSYIYKIAMREGSDTLEISHDFNLLNYAFLRVDTLRLLRVDTLIHKPSIGEGERLLCLLGGGILAAIVILTLLLLGAD